MMNEKEPISIKEQLENDGSIVHAIKGVSMMPLLRQGIDVAVIEKKGEARCKKYDVPLYLRADGKYVLHRIFEVRENDYVICGDNCSFYEYGITDDDIVGVMSGIIRDGKFISVEDEWYKRYVKRICGVFPLRIAYRRTRHFAGKILRKILKRK